VTITTPPSGTVCKHTAHTTSYSTSVWTVCILCCFRVTASYLSKVAHFNLPYLHLAPQLGVTPFKFCGNLCCQKTRAPGQSCGIACVILCLAFMTQYWRLSNRWTDRWMSCKRTRYYSRTGSCNTNLTQ